MQIHFSQDLKLNDSKKENISDLVCQRIRLLIGERKASCIENVFFCDTLLNDALSLHNSPISYGHNVCLLKDCGKANLYFSAQMLYTLIRQTTESPSFDEAMLAISRKIYF